ncbi:hypothetical protein K438DRAFT_1872413 [Mycena galopus ATCC 62051]|nr:hypothetical protein K438DRAFT_1900355 [Mycena galopus ATCC 62051]KAF8145179.1 hypothetical protein K438DRAFT_1872413 [Mycena galopus ATCC 62051]
MSEAGIQVIGTLVLEQKTPGHGCEGRAALSGREMKPRRSGAEAVRKAPLPCTWKAMPLGCGRRWRAAQWIARTFREATSFKRDPWERSGSGWQSLGGWRVLGSRPSSSYGRNTRERFHCEREVYQPRDLKKVSASDIDVSTGVPV